MLEWLASPTSTPATMTRRSAGSSHRTGGARTTQVWARTGMPMPSMIRSMEVIRTGMSAWKLVPYFGQRRVNASV